MTAPKHSNLRRLLLGDFTLKRLVRSLLLIYLFFMVYVFVSADRMIFLLPASSYTDTPDVIKIVEPLSAHQLSGLYLPALSSITADSIHPISPASIPYTVLYSHGNAEDLGLIRPVLHLLQNSGLSVLAYDYPGYGTSEGKPTEKSVYQAIDAAYNYLTQERKIPADHILVYGRSVGGGPSTYLASQPSKAIAGLILESTFTSAFRTVIPFPILPFDKFPNLKHLNQYGGPVLVMHGTEDKTIAFNHGETLFERTTGTKQFLSVEGAGHDDLGWVAGDRYLNAIQAFIHLVRTAGSS